MAGDIRPGQLWVFDNCVNVTGSLPDLMLIVEKDESDHVQANGYDGWTCLMHWYPGWGPHGSGPASNELRFQHDHMIKNHYRLLNNGPDDE